MSPAPTPPVERELAFDMVRHAVPLAPVVVLLSLVVRGGDGAWSAVVAVAVVAVNLVLSALALEWAAKVGASALMAVALGGFLVRMGLVTAVVFAVKDQAWIDLPTLAVAILGTHLALLAWETRYVSATLAYPGLKPSSTEEVAST
jgi:hypothetical protein